MKLKPQCHLASETYDCIYAYTWEVYSIKCHFKLTSLEWMGFIEFKSKFCSSRDFVVTLYVQSSTCSVCNRGNTLFLLFLIAYTGNIKNELFQLVICRVPCKSIKFSLIPFCNITSTKCALFCRDIFVQNLCDQ